MLPGSFCPFSLHGRSPLSSQIRRGVLGLVTYVFGAAVTLPAGKCLGHRRTWALREGGGKTLRLPIPHSLPVGGSCLTTPPFVPHLHPDLVQPSFFEHLLWIEPPSQHGGFSEGKYTLLPTRSVLSSEVVLKAGL